MILGFGANFIFTWNRIIPTNPNCRRHYNDTTRMSIEYYWSWDLSRAANLTHIRKTLSFSIRQLDFLILWSDPEGFCTLRKGLICRFQFHKAVRKASLLTFRWTRPEYNHAANSLGYRLAKSLYLSRVVPCIRHEHSRKFTTYYPERSEEKPWQRFSEAARQPSCGWHFNSGNTNFSKNG